MAMKHSEFMRNREKLKESILNIGKEIEENSEKILDKASTLSCFLSHQVLTDGVEV